MSTELERLAWPDPRRLPADQDRSDLARELMETEAKMVALLGAVPYHDYLGSAHWQRTRQLALEHYGRACFRCGTSAHLQVHHRTYERRGSERLVDLAVYCDTCHQRLHHAA